MGKTIPRAFKALRSYISFRMFIWCGSKGLECFIPSCSTGVPYAFSGGKLGSMSKSSGDDNLGECIIVL